MYTVIRDVPNIRFIFASVPNIGPNSVFVFGRIVPSERIRIAVMGKSQIKSQVQITNHLQK